MHLPSRTHVLSISYCMKILIGKRIGDNTDLIRYVNIVVYLIRRLELSDIPDYITIIYAFCNLLCPHSRLCFRCNSIADFSVIFCHFEFSLRQVLLLGIEVVRRKRSGNFLDNQNLDSRAVLYKTKGLIKITLHFNDHTLHKQILHFRRRKQFLSGGIVRQMLFVIGSIQLNRGNILIFRSIINLLHIM
nr:MAG TPA: hypothetical protein [Caudoviricetes sp.]